MSRFRLNPRLAAAASVLLLAIGLSADQTAGALAGTQPRTADGKPNLQGIWQVHNRAAYDLEDHDAKLGMPPGRGVVEGGGIPYQPWAAAKKAENFSRRQAADPLVKCYMPGVPRIMYMEYPFHIFQSREQIAILFEWSQVFRLIYTNGSAAPAGIDFWMGDSRGHWEGDTLVATVTNHNDKTWPEIFTAMRCAWSNATH
jgi:hypothetical protein